MALTSALSQRERETARQMTGVLLRARWAGGRCAMIRDRGG